MLGRVTWATGLLAVLLLSGACAGPARGGRAASAVAKAPAAPAPSDSGRGPFLWEVEGPGGTSYLYGTIHVLGADAVPQAARERLSRARTFVMEADIDTLEPQKLVQLALLPAGKTLDTMMPEKVWRQVVALVGSRFPEPLLKQFEPWFVGTLIVFGIVRAERPTDLVLLDEAKKQGKKLAYLESVEEQLTAMRASSTVKDLIETVERFDKLREALLGLVRAYRAGDLEAMDRALADPKLMRPESRATIIDSRNLRWVARLEKHLALGGAFVAVGLGHFPGPKGLLALLRAKGYAIRRVR